MNKIILDNNNKIDLVINENSICNINKKYNITELNIIIKDNSKLIINHYSEIDKKRLNININQENNTEFIYNHSFLNKDEYELNININLISNNSKNTINISGISDKGNSNILINGRVNKDTLDNELYENIKMLNINEGKSSIIPNMFINTKNVIANHAASITNIDENYLFYLNNKGIKNEDGIKLIMSGFLDNEAK